MLGNYDNVFYAYTPSKVNNIRQNFLYGGQANCKFFNPFVNKIPLQKTASTEGIIENQYLNKKVFF
jgi:hypothetical protein